MASQRETESLADSIVRYLTEGQPEKRGLEVKTDGNVIHTIFQRISGSQDFKMSLRTRKPIRNAIVCLSQEEKVILEKKMPKTIPAEMIQIPVKAGRIVIRDVLPCSCTSLQTMKGVTYC